MAFREYKIMRPTNGLFLWLAVAGLGLAIGASAGKADEATVPTDLALPTPQALAAATGSLSEAGAAGRLFLPGLQGGRATFPTSVELFALTGPPDHGTTGPLSEDHETTRPRDHETTPDSGSVVSGPVVSGRQLGLIA